MSRAAEVMQVVPGREGWSALARAGDGLIFLSPPAGASLASVTSQLVSLRRGAEEMGGHAVLEVGPVELKREFPVWGEVRNLDLMHELKRCYDPSGVLGCGRWVV